MNRKLHLDIIRLLAAIAVIVLHVTAQNYNSVAVETFEFQVFAVVNGIVRWCVPAFIMISGELFLGKAISVHQIYRKYIMRLALALVVWSSIYAVWGLMMGNGIGESIGQLVTGHYHLWYLYMIIGLYMLIPILNCVIKHPAIEKYILYLGFFFGIFIPSLSRFFEWKLVAAHSWIETITGNMKMSLASNYVFFFLLGSYLGRHRLKKKQCIILSISAIVSMAFSIILTLQASRQMHHPFSGFYESDSLLVMIEACAVFTCCMAIEKNFVKLSIAKFFIRLVPLEFGVYLVHPLIIEFLKNILGIDTLSFPVLFSVIILSAIVTIVAFLISFILQRIPIMKRFCL